jgi:hypothetical protein
MLSCNVVVVPVPVPVPVHVDVDVDVDVATCKECNASTAMAMGTCKMLALN